MKKNETASIITDSESFWVGGRVYWTAGNSRREGLIIDIYNSGTTKGLSSRCVSDRVLVIQQRDGKVLMKLEGEVSPL